MKTIDQTGSKAHNLTQITCRALVMRTIVLKTKDYIIKFLFTFSSHISNDLTEGM